MLELLLVGACLSVLPATEVEDESGLGVEALASPASSNSALPNLSLGGDGKVRLSWVDREGEKLGILRFAVLEESGWSAPREIVRGTDLFLNWADFPSVAALESGVLMAHWLRNTEEDYCYNAEFALSSDGGVTWSEPRTLHEDTGEAEHGFVSIVPMDSERFGAIWLDGRDTVGKEPGEGEFALYSRIINAAGELSEEQVLDSRVCSCCQTSLVADAQGVLLATYRDRSMDEVRDISQQTRNPFHSEHWRDSQTLVHADGWQIEGCPVNGPRGAFSQTGETGTQSEQTATAWFTGAGEGGGDVRLAFADVVFGAATYGSPIKIDNESAIGRVDVVFADADSVIVTWLEDIGDARAEWRARRVWKDGRMAQPLAIAGVPSTRGAGFLRMVSTGGEQPEQVVAWTSITKEHPGGQVMTAKLRVK